MFDENTDENIVVGTILILFPNFKTKQRCSIDPNSKTIKAKNVVRFKAGAELAGKVK